MYMLYTEVETDPYFVDLCWNEGTLRNSHVFFIEIKFIQQTFRFFPAIVFSSVVVLLVRFLKDGIFLSLWTAKLTVYITLAGNLYFPTKMRIVFIQTCKVIIMAPTGSLNNDDDDDEHYHKDDHDDELIIMMQSVILNWARPHFNGNPKCVAE